jgi:hypothetical protein
MSTIPSLSETEVFQMECCAEELLKNNVPLHKPQLFELAIRIQVTIDALKVFRESGIKSKCRDDLVFSLNDLCIVFYDICRKIS